MNYLFFPEHILSFLSIFFITIHLSDREQRNIHYSNSARCSLTSFLKTYLNHFFFYIYIIQSISQIEIIQINMLFMIVKSLRLSQMASKLKVG